VQSNSFQFLGGDDGRGAWCVVRDYYITYDDVIADILYNTLPPSYALYTAIPKFLLPEVASAERSGPSGPLL
jgi:hypothetical protein